MKDKSFFAAHKIRRSIKSLSLVILLTIQLALTGCLAHENRLTISANTKFEHVLIGTRVNQNNTSSTNENFETQNQISEITPTPIVNDTITDTTTKNQIEEPTSTSEKVQVKKKDEKTSVTLLAVGDNLIHSQIIKSGKQRNGSYNYDHLYTLIKDKISAADISVVNQETILGGNSFTYSGYPAFNSPTQIGDALINAGFDVVLHATNHTMDKGLKGVENTYSYWKKHPKIKVVGINMTKKQSDQIPIIKKNGIKIAILNYTYGLNGYRNPKNKPYLVNLLDKNKIKKDVMNAKRKADFVIVFPHWGIEYVLKPSRQQKEMTKYLSDLGVDLVIGSHPHVLEPVEWIKTKKDHKMLVYYSLGNFVSFQTEAPRMLGGIAEVTITKEKNATYISKSSITPIIFHYEHGPSNYHFGVYELSKYNKKLALAHGVSNLSTQGPLTYQGIYALAKKVLGSWLK